MASCCLFAALSKLFGSFCGSSGSTYSCTCINVGGGQINCCSKVVVVDHVDKQENKASLEEFVRDKFGSTPNESFRTISSSRIDDFDQKALQAIKDFSVSRFKQLCPNIAAPPRRIQDEGWARFQIAEKLSRVDLEGKYYDMKEGEIEPLMDRESRRFVEMVDLIQKYGSQAALLWQTLKNESYANVRKSLNPAQLKILTKRGSDPDFIELLRSAKNFCDLGQDIATFLLMAQKTSKLTQEFVFWNPTGQVLSSGALYRTIKRESVQGALVGAGVGGAEEDIPISQPLELGSDAQQFADQLNPVGLQSQIGSLRLQAIAISLGWELKKLQRDLHKSDKKKIEAKIIELKKRDAAIAHVYAVLKNSRTGEDIQAALPPKGYAKITRLDKKDCFSFLAEVTASSKIADLSPHRIAMLLTIAEEFSQDLLEQTRSRFSLDSWLIDLKVRSTRV